MPGDLSYLIHGLCLLLGFFSWHRLALLLLKRRIRPQDCPLLPADLPPVLVQVPLYNEPTCCERVIDAICALDYPRALLSIQILDDSTDETSLRVGEKVKLWVKKGVAIRHLQRGERKGFKAGALANGLQENNAPFVALFDADFVPPADFLKKLLPYFSNPKVGMVQARWGHLNKDVSLLTRAQATLLDAHFCVEHVVRNGLNWFFNFNGTAGIWRRDAINSAGGWSADTVTEDLDLSLRASKKGWTFIYAYDVVVPASLPQSLSAWRTQQRRWVCGGIQTALKHLRFHWPTIKWFCTGGDKLAILLQNFVYFPLSLLVLLLPIYPFVTATKAFSWWDLSFGLLLFGSIFLPMAFFFWEGLQGIERWQTRSLHLFLGMSLSGALVFNNFAGAFQGFFGRASVPFQRTPKGQKEARRAPRQRMQIILESVFSVLYLVGICQCIYRQLWGMLPFLGLLAFGFCYFSFINLQGSKLVQRILLFVSGFVAKKRLPSHN